MILWFVGAGWLVSCGTVGPIVAPQDIGVNVKRQKDLAEKERLQQETQHRKGSEESRPALPGPEVPTGQSMEEEQEEKPPPPLPGKIVDPSARPTGDVFVMPR